MLTPTFRRAEYKNLLQYLMKSLHLWHTHTNESPGLFVCFQSRRVVLGTVPHPTDTDRSWIESSGMAQFRCQNQSKAAEFWEDPPNTETCVALKWSPGFLHLWEGLLIDVPQNPDSDLFLKKVQLCCYIVAKIYLHAHLAFQASISSSRLEIVLSELWLQIFKFYQREHIK